MQKSRRSFLTKSLFGFTSFGLLAACGLGTTSNEGENKKRTTPAAPYTDGLVISTWDAGLKANAAAIAAMQAGGNSLDMAEKGVNHTEADFSNLSVGLGGLPDREGHTTLDACIMDSNGNAGSVMFLEKIKHPSSVARRVMEKTPHIQLVGEGAFRFAIDEGFPQDDFISEKAQAAYKDWLKKSSYKPIINIENHDTIGLLAMDKAGDISGACTTSGLAYKMRGRVGDSPIIGAGLYVDNEVGAATSTGLGEAVIKICGSFLIVELMRGGATPQEACEEAVNRLKKKNSNYKDIQVGFLAINKTGDVGAFALQKGFTYALHKSGENKLYQSASLFS